MLKRCEENVNLSDQAAERFGVRQKPRDSLTKEARQYGEEPLVVGIRNVTGVCTRRAQMNAQYSTLSYRALIEPYHKAAAVGPRRRRPWRPSPPPGPPLTTLHLPSTFTQFSSAMCTICGMHWSDLTLRRRLDLRLSYVPPLLARARTCLVFPMILHSPVENAKALSHDPPATRQTLRAAGATHLSCA